MSRPGAPPKKKPKKKQMIRNPMASEAEEVGRTDEMTEREAIDYIEYNIAGSYVGELTPILVRSLDEVEKFIIDKQTKSVFTDKKIDDKEIN